MPDLSGDLDFLLRAANYGGGNDAPHSEAARAAVDLVAERIRLVADMQLKVARKRLKKKTAAELAATADEQGLPVS